MLFRIEYQVKGESNMRSPADDRLRSNQVGWLHATRQKERDLPLLRTRPLKTHCPQQQQQKHHALVMSILLLISYCLFFGVNANDESEMNFYASLFKEYVNSYGDGSFASPPSPIPPPAPVPPIPRPYRPYQSWYHYNVPQMSFAMVPVPPNYIDYKDTVIKLPPFLEWIVQRVQNYYSTSHGVPPDEPIRPPKSTTTKTTITPLPPSKSSTVKMTTENETTNLYTNNPETQPSTSTTSSIITTITTPIVFADRIIIKPTEETSETPTTEEPSETTTTEEMNTIKIIYKPGEGIETSQSSTISEENITENIYNITNGVIFGKPNIDQEKVTVGLNTLYTVGGTGPISIEDHIINSVYNITQEKQSTTTISPSSTPSKKVYPKSPIIDSSAIYFPKYQFNDEPSDLPHPRELW